MVWSSEVTVGLHSKSSEVGNQTLVNKNAEFFQRVKHFIQGSVEIFINVKQSKKHAYLIAVICVNSMNGESREMHRSGVNMQYNGGNGGFMMVADVSSSLSSIPKYIHNILSQWKCSGIGQTPFSRATYDYLIYTTERLIDLLKGPERDLNSRPSDQTSNI